MKVLNRARGLRRLTKMISNTITMQDQAGRIDQARLVITTCMKTSINR